MLFMNGSRLKKLNGADTSAAVENDILGAGYAPFEEGALEGLAAMEIFKARGRRTRRRKKEDGKYVRLYLYSSPDSAESWEFVVMNAEKKHRKRGADGKKFEPLYYKIFFKKI